MLSTALVTLAFTTDSLRLGHLQNNETEELQSGYLLGLELTCGDLHLYGGGAFLSFAPKFNLIASGHSYTDNTRCKNITFCALNVLYKCMTLAYDLILYLFILLSVDDCIILNILTSSNGKGIRGAEDGTEG